jgi:hypothetical protein
MLTPTVAVICVVALAACGQIKLKITLKITPTVTSAAAARTLIRVRRIGCDLQ